MIRYSHLFGYLAGLLMLCPPPVVLAVEAGYTFAVVPQQSASKTIEEWGPMIREISSRTGHAFRLVTSKDIPTFSRELMDGRFDVAYMSPAHYVAAHKSAGYLPLVHARDQLLSGIIVVHKDSGIQVLSDLANMTVAFPSRSAIGATLLPLAMLKQADITVNPAYVVSHESVYLNVAQRRYEAGGGIPRTLANMPTEIRSQLRVLWTSPGYTPHAIASHPRLGVDVRQSVTDALVAMEATEAGRKILGRIGVKGWIEATDSDWDDVRGLNLEEP